MLLFNCPKCNYKFMVDPKSTTIVCTHCGATYNVGPVAPQPAPKPAPAPTPTPPQSLSTPVYETPVYAEPKTAVPPVASEPVAKIPPVASEPVAKVPPVAVTPPPVVETPPVDAPQPVAEVPPVVQEPVAKTPAEPVKEEKPLVMVMDDEEDNPFHIDPAAIDHANREQDFVERFGLRPGVNSGTIINRNGKVVFAHPHFVDIGHFNNGLAKVYYKQTQRRGFIDHEGNIVIPCQWKALGDFSEYVAAVVNDNAHCGYIDVTGREVIPFVWKDGWPFHNGYAKVMDFNNRMGVIDTTGKLVIPCKWIAMGDISEGLLNVKNEKGLCGYVDMTGREVVPCQWKECWTVEDGMGIVQDKVSRRLGFVNTDGELVIPPRFRRADNFKNGVARVSESMNFLFEDKWFFIDKQGNTVM